MNRGVGRQVGPESGTPCRSHSSSRSRPRTQLVPSPGSYWLTEVGAEPDRLCFLKEQSRKGRGLGDLSRGQGVEEECLMPVSRELQGDPSGGAWRGKEF